MHNAAIRALGLDAVYVAIRTPAAALPPLLAALGAVGGAGNVTVPHKEAVERCLARKTDLCARVGACNTFWTEQGELVGPERIDRKSTRLNSSHGSISYAV